VQKAFYSLLLERRIGEFPLPKGTWVVAAGNRAEDHALVRTMSSALVNRVLILRVRTDLKEWLAWAREHGVRQEIMTFLAFLPEALARPAPADPVPFSTPRAWAQLSRALDLAESCDALTDETRRALVFGRVSAQDAAMFCALSDRQIDESRPIIDYVRKPHLLPVGIVARWLIVSRVRDAVARSDLNITPNEATTFLRTLSMEQCCAALLGLVPQWSALGADDVMFDTLLEVTGLA
jgi:MoxR-like ATPase